MATTSSGNVPPPLKQIRFVNNQGQPPSKRRRVNAACLTCRKRKTRCDGEKPTCSTCDKNGHQCLGYPDHPEKTKSEAASVAVKLEAEEASNGSAGADKHRTKDAADEDMDDGGPVKAHNGGHTHVGTEPTTPARKRSESMSTSSGATALRIRTDSSDCDRELSNAQTPGQSAKRASCQRAVSFSEDGRSSSNRSPVQHLHEINKVPYFRYFGPTAIVPGFKQMVVNVQHYNQRRSRGGSLSAISPIAPLDHHHGAPSHAETVLEALDDMPVYDPNNEAPVHPIIVNLIKTFFLHLGCTLPFLREEKILRLVKEKRLDSILVDAMCALAARFSNIDTFPGFVNGSRSEYGTVFAQRAKAATVDTFPCPTVGAVQAYLLMAYEGFGANQDSALWMYLGLAIRMAFDLGLQRNEGVQYQGDKDPWYTRSWNRLNADEEDAISPISDAEILNQKEQQEIVQERIDTAWAVYILDRVISSGTGRTVTVRDEEFELPTPEPIVDPLTGWPAPHPAFIQIIQLYGRVSDILNKLKKVSDLTEAKMATLAKIECDLTKLYHRQDPRLHFNPLHFQNYVKNGQGTLFILLHVWFHALIIIIHQPLLTPFGSRQPQLTSHSRELAMSSAKTIADILALAELIDPNSYTGSPFVSQPIYIAACAFLTESAANSFAPVSRDASPPGQSSGCPDKATASAEKLSKHSLLAEAANQNYQRCYKSLQQVQNYWEGANYILVALGHRSKGIWDCETYTAEEYESTKMPRRPGPLASFPRLDNPSSPQPNVPPIAWSVTGTTNSPNSNVTFLYQNMNAGQSQPTPGHPHHQLPPAPASAPTPPGNMIYDPIRQSLPESTGPFPPAFPQATLSAIRYSTHHSNASGFNPSLSSHTAVGNRRSALKLDNMSGGDSGPGTPGSETRIQMLSGIAGNSVLPPLPSQPYTPSSSNYEPSLLPGTSPESPLTDHIVPHQHRAHAGSNVTGANPSGMVGSYGHDFAQSGLASGSYSYLGSGAPIADAITVEEVNISNLDSLGLSNDLTVPWDFFSGTYSGIFDANNMGNAGHQGPL